MAQKFQELSITPAVSEAQKRYYGKARQPMPASGNDKLTHDEIDFIATRDSFYMSTISANGWPYIQHRGGAPGFLHVCDSGALAFADYKGNRQLLSTGNLATNDRVALFLMDYPMQTRLKIMGHARVEDARQHPDLLEKLAEPEVRTSVERLFFIDVVSYDWNCPQHITQRYTIPEIREMVKPLQARIAELEAQLKSKAPETDAS